MKTLLNGVFLCLILALTNVAFGQTGWSQAMSRTPMTQFNDEDVDLFIQAGTRVLEEVQDGDSESWKNEATGSNGTITALSSSEIDGKPCRRVQIENQSRSYFNRSTVTFCRQEDGGWLWQQEPE